MIAAKFKQWSCWVKLERYPADNSIAIRLIDENDSSPIAIATVCLIQHGLTPPEGHCYIKNYSENKGILDALTEAGVVEPTGETVSFGYVEAHVCRVLID